MFAVAPNAVRIDMMPSFTNLISDSLLVNDTIRLLTQNGGTASVSAVVDSVMNINSAGTGLAATLVSEMIDGDPRILVDGETVRLAEDRAGSLKLNETEFVVFDLETTGTKAPPCRVTEIGACKIRNSSIVAEFQSLVNPEVPIPEFITGLTGIDDAMVKNAPRFADIAPAFLDFMGESVLVAHNAPFDMRFLNHEIRRIHANRRVANPHLCTVRLSRKLIPELENHRLATVANFYSVDLTNHHRAAADAGATARIFLRFLELLKEKGVTDLRRVSSYDF